MRSYASGAEPAIRGRYSGIYGGFSRLSWLNGIQLIEIIRSSTGPQTAPTAKQPFAAKPLFGCHVANFAWGSVAYGNVLDV